MNVHELARIVVLSQNYMSDMQQIGKLKARLRSLIDNRPVDGELELFQGLSNYKEFRANLIKKIEAGIAELESRWQMYSPEDVLNYITNDDSFIGRSLSNG